MSPHIYRYKYHFNKTKLEEIYMHPLALRQLPFPVVASPRIIYIPTYIHVYRGVFMVFFFLFTVCSPAITVSNALSGGHPTCIKCI